MGGWSRPFQKKKFNELIFDIRWGQYPFYPDFVYIFHVVFDFMH